MPLPATLVAKLSKRGIIQASTNKQIDNEKKHKGVSSCPNKYNIYHNCTVWCQTHWKGFIAPDPKYTIKIRRMLEKYPLPHNWTEIFDKGVGRYYYWNMETNMVSWLPPRHPKSKITDPAAKFRMRLHNPQGELETERKKVIKVPEKVEKHRDKYEKRHSRYDDKGHKKRTRKDDLDPMDPAAYSDIPKGTWSDGLENNKSKVDSTASGALFQQRPYPSPGEVIAANNKLKSKKK